MFPSARSVENPEALEEERRLFYVGLTRCRDELYVTYPDMRLNASYSEALQRPSRFLSEIPESLLETWEISTSTPGRTEPF
jgi:DNA helicase-2/ATP-dependent DNA helicase PcrA